MRLENIKDVIIGKEIPRGVEYPNINLKFSSFEYAYKNTSDYVKMILDFMPIQNDRKYVLVDIKVHSLKMREYPSLRHWHCDCVAEPNNPARIEHNHIFIHGNGCLTEFLKDEIEYHGENLNELLKNAEGENIPAGRICSYGRAIHRATAAKFDCKRLLIRVTESDIITPNNKEFKVRTYR